MVESELAAPATTATAAPMAIRALVLRPATVPPAAAPVAPAAGAAAGGTGAPPTGAVVCAIACAEANRIAEAIRTFFMGYPLELNREVKRKLMNLVHDCSNIPHISLRCTLVMAIIKGNQLLS